MSPLSVKCGGWLAQLASNDTAGPTGVPRGAGRGVLGSPFPNALSVRKLRVGRFTSPFGDGRGKPRTPLPAGPLMGPPVSARSPPGRSAVPASWVWPPPIPSSSAPWHLSPPAHRLPLLQNSLKSLICGSPLSLCSLLNFTVIAPNDVLCVQLRPP